MVRAGTGGAIVNLESTAAVTSFPYGLAYGVAWAGVSSLTRTLAVEWGRFGIRVNAVAPGSIQVPRGDAEAATDPLPSVPLGRRGSPDEIGGVVAFLLSPLASYLSGRTLVVDGGATVVPPSVGEGLVPSSIAGGPFVDGLLAAWDESVEAARSTLSTPARGT
jgi:NAD(P)-dependent dehydrogenase (short-subunit alcohol dehydrogenase family)